MAVYVPPRCKKCHEPLEAYLANQDEWLWWCETCHERDAEPEEES